MASDGHALSVRAIREVARTFGAALRIAAQLRRRKPGDPADWFELQNFPGGGLTTTRDPDDRFDYRLRQERYAHWLEHCFDVCDVGHQILWRSRAGLQVSPEARGLLGVLVILLYRESVGHDALHCENCGNPVDRVRRPRRGERVYCQEVDCQRARARENQRRSRAERKA